jgi:hypothetical protein
LTFLRFFAVPFDRTGAGRFLVMWNLSVEVESPGANGQAKGVETHPFALTTRRKVVVGAFPTRMAIRVGNWLDQIRRNRRRYQPRQLSTRR